MSVVQINQDHILGQGLVGSQFCSRRKFESDFPRVIVRLHSNDLASNLWLVRQLQLKVASNLGTAPNVILALH
jgi:hypothetical protein